MIAFIIFTIFFIFPFSIIPIIMPFKFPHEIPMYLINYIFLGMEILLGFFVMCRFMNTQSAAFYLRTAPLIDRLFQFKYNRNGAGEIKTSRQIELGVRRPDRGKDMEAEVFQDSDQLVPSVDVN
jgi:hypothetical protein